MYSEEKGLQIVHKLLMTIGPLIPCSKDCATMGKVPGVVYCILCVECPSSYIGETKNLFGRIRQHKNNVRKQNKERSAIAKHFEAADHKMDFDRVAIFEKETN